MVLNVADGASKKRLSAGAIAGIVVGASVLAMLVTGLILYMVHRKRQPSPALMAQLERCKKLSMPYCMMFLLRISFSSSS